MVYHGARVIRINWLDRMNAALDYIEENLAGEIDMSVAASRACCSQYHFTRFFSFVANLPLSEYIRRRRLTLAGFELKNGDAKIIELAHKYGYDSPNSFTRAFQAMHGVTPSQARIAGVELKSFARISFLITIKGDAPLKYRIVEEEAFTLFGVSLPTTVTGERCYTDIPVFWGKCENDRTTNRIVEAGQGDSETLLSGAAFDIDENGSMKYMICMDLPEGGAPTGFETLDVPARTWAVFPVVCAGPEDTIQSIWKRIYPEWFPYSGYEMDTGPQLERYDRIDGKFTAEVWIPVVKKVR